MSGVAAANATTMASRPVLAQTAVEVWRQWKAQDYLMGTSCFARAIGDECLGELVWGVGDGPQPQLCRVIDQVGVKPLTASEEDRVWEALLEGRLHIYRRRNAPSIGATYVTEVLHQATARPIQSGIN